MNSKFITSCHAFKSSILIRGTPCLKGDTLLGVLHHIFNQKLINVGDLR